MLFFSSSKTKALTFLFFFTFLFLSLSFPTQASLLTKKKWEDLSNHDISDDWGKYALEKISPDDWKHAETEHFIIHYGRDASRIARRLEKSYKDVRELFEGKEDLKGKWKSHVFVFERWEDWDTFQRKMLDASEERNFGGVCRGLEFYFPGRGPNGKFDSKGKTLTHEMSHLVVNRIFMRRLPSWLNEGIAEYFGEREKLSLRGFRKKMARNKLNLDLKKFTSNDYHFMNLEGSQLMAHYAEAAMLVDFLTSKHSKKQLVQLVEYVIEGGTMEKASVEIYKYKDFEDFEKAYQKYRRKFR